MTAYGARLVLADERGFAPGTIPGSSLEPGAKDHSSVEAWLRGRTPVIAQNAS